MSMLHRFVASAACWGALGSLALAQEAPAPKPPSPVPALRRQAAPLPPPPAPQQQRRTAYRPAQYQQDFRNHPANRSILRNGPTYSSTEYSWGFRNPGGVGRFEEYYPPGDVFQYGGRDPVPRAGFDQGTGVGSVSQQAVAVQTGTQRYSVMQQHLDNFSRPLGFYGYGGFFGFGPF